MGYYTDFTLTAKPGFTEDESIDFAATFEGVTDYQVERQGNSKFVMYGVKWYNHHTDMTTLSQMYPDRVFTLEGVGEEKDDEWCKYYKNGKFQNSDLKIVKTKDKYDESKLR